MCVCGIQFPLDGNRRSVRQSVHVDALTRQKETTNTGLPPRFVHPLGCVDTLMTYSLSFRSRCCLWTRRPHAGLDVDCVRSSNRVARQRRRQQHPLPPSTSKQASNTGTDHLVCGVTCSTVHLSLSLSVCVCEATVALSHHVGRCRILCQQEEKEKDQGFQGLQCQQD